MVEEEGKQGEQGEQGEMNLPCTHSVGEMGILISPHTIYLHRLFLRDKLQPPIFGVGLGWHQQEITNIGCPFCREGFLKLEEVNPAYSGGPHPDPVPSSMHHIGNRCKYICSNDECDGIFVGIYQWMWID